MVEINKEGLQQDLPKEDPRVIFTRIDAVRKAHQTDSQVWSYGDQKALLKDYTDLLPLLGSESDTNKKVYFYLRKLFRHSGAEGMVTGSIGDAVRVLNAATLIENSNVSVETPHEEATGIVIRLRTLDIADIMNDDINLLTSLGLTEQDPDVKQLVADSRQAVAVFRNTPKQREDSAPSPVRGVFSKIEQILARQPEGQNLLNSVDVEILTTELSKLTDLIGDESSQTAIVYEYLRKLSKQTGVDYWVNINLLSNLYEIKNIVAEMIEKGHTKDPEASTYKQRASIHYTALKSRYKFAKTVRLDKTGDFAKTVMGRVEELDKVLEGDMPGDWAHGKEVEGKKELELSVSKTEKADQSAEIQGMVGPIPLDTTVSIEEDNPAIARQKQVRAEILQVVKELDTAEWDTGRFDQDRKDDWRTGENWTYSRKRRIVYKISQLATTVSEDCPLDSGTRLYVEDLMRRAKAQEQWLAMFNEYIGYAYLTYHNMEKLTHAKLLEDIGNAENFLKANYLFNIINQEDTEYMKEYMWQKSRFDGLQALR